MCKNSEQGCDCEENILRIAGRKAHINNAGKKNTYAVMYLASLTHYPHHVIIGAAF